MYVESVSVPIATDKVKHEFSNKVGLHQKISEFNTTRFVYD